MGKTFENILKNANSKGIDNDKSKESINWFRSNIRKSTRSVSSNRLFKEEKGSLVNSWSSVGIGKVYFATYDPKHKKTLPYYDTFPVMIPIHKYNDGFLALNMHYLPPLLRAKLLDGLLENTNKAKSDEKMKMKLDYGLLKSASQLKHFQPCIKRYLGKHFRSRFIRVAPENWVSAVFLPVENFQKASKNKVWADSRKMLR